MPSLQLCIPQQLFQLEIFFIKILAWRYCDIFKTDYCSSTVQQGLAFKKLNGDLQLQADFAISHSYDANADYSPDSDCSAAQPRS